jgi:hypothetical protein
MPLPAPRRHIPGLADEAATPVNRPGGLLYDLPPCFPAVPGTFSLGGLLLLGVITATGEACPQRSRWPRIECMRMLLVVSSMVVTAGCSDCLVECALGYEPVPGACSCRLVQDFGGAPDASLDSPPPSPGGCSCVVQGASSIAFIQMPLECLCASGNCPATIADLGLGMACADGGIGGGQKGCGKVAIQGTLGTGSSPIYDAQSGKLVGVYEYSDILHGPCNVFAYVYGEGLFPPGPGLTATRGSSCETITACNACGSTTVPACF